MTIDPNKYRTAPVMQQMHEQTWCKLVMSVSETQLLQLTWGFDLQQRATVHAVGTNLERALVCSQQSTILFAPSFALLPH